MASFYLAQPSAPHFYEVDGDDGKRYTIRRDGDEWTDAEHYPVRLPPVDAYSIDLTKLEESKENGTIRKEVSMIPLAKTQASPGSTHPVRHGARKKVRVCRVCGCTDMDCSGCIERTGEPCSWVEKDLCSACAPVKNTNFDPSSLHAKTRKENPFVTQQRASCAEAAAIGTARKAQVPAAVNLVRKRSKPSTLQELLDDARDLYREALDRELDDMPEKFVAYTTLIERVNREDPTFYAGRKP